MNKTATLWHKIIAMIIVALILFSATLGPWLIGRYVFRPQLPNWVEQVVSLLLFAGSVFVLGYVVGAWMQRRQEKNL